MLIVEGAVYLRGLRVSTQYLLPPPCGNLFPAWTSRASWHGGESGKLRRLRRRNDMSFWRGFPEQFLILSDVRNGSRLCGNPGETGWRGKFVQFPEGTIF